MATAKNLIIRKNRNTILKINVTGVEDWTDLSALFCIGASLKEDPEVEVTGVIDEEEDSIVVEIAPDLELEGVYEYELVIYNDDESYIKTVLYGKLTVVDVLKEFTEIIPEP